MERNFTAKRNTDMGQIETLFSGALGAAIVAGVFGIIQYRLKKKDDKKAAESAEREALRYLMLYIIEERCKEHIAAGEISTQDLRCIGKWHNVYHAGLGGNGDADDLMNRLKTLELITSD